MDDDMASRKVGSNVENAELRSVYGDMHAHREALMNAEHVAFLRRHGMIDAAISVELMKPVEKDRKYTEDYLRTHPDYTGVRPEMTAFSTANRHQKQQDKDMKNFVKDYEAGRIDDDGNPIAQDTVIETTESESNSYFTTLENFLCGDTEPLEELEDPSLITSSTAMSAAIPKSPALATASDSPSPSSHAFEASSTPEPRSRKRKYRVGPLQPLPGGEDYSQYKYYHLLAVCRERQIFSAGDTQQVRNCLIQDDIHIQQGLTRNIAKWKRSARKKFKHDVPDALKRG